VTVSVMGVPPYITFNPDTKVLGGIDVAFFKIIAEKFRLKVTMKPEKTWSDFQTYFRTAQKKLHRFTNKKKIIFLK
jgi:hypothetical protein